MTGIFAGPEAPKQLVNAYIDAGGTGSELMGLLLRGEAIPEPVKMLIGKRMRRSLEQRIRRARKQLRQSKTFFGNDRTKTLIIFAMDKPPLFGHSSMLTHIAKVMSDNYSNADRRRHLSKPKHQLRCRMTEWNCLVGIRSTAMMMPTKN